MQYLMVLILFLSQIVMDMGMVSYENRSTYFYMMMFLFRGAIAPEKDVKMKLNKGYVRIAMSFLAKPSIV